MRVFGCRSEQNISQANFVHLLFYFKLNTLQPLASCWARIISQAAAIPGACVCVEVGRGVLGWGGGACCLSTHKHAKDNAQRKRERWKEQESEIERKRFQKRLHKASVSGM